MPTMPIPPLGPPDDGDWAYDPSCTCVICRDRTLRDRTQARARDLFADVMVTVESPVDDEPTPGVWCSWCGSTRCTNTRCPSCGVCYPPGMEASHTICDNCQRCRRYCGGGPCTSCGSCRCGGPCGSCGSCDCNGPCDYCDSCDCNADCEDHPNMLDGRLHSYSYRPSPRFYGHGPLFLGMELEIETPRMNRSLSIVEEHFGRTAYVKEDSSISHGFEIVTHPMDWSYVDGNFPWPVLPALRASGAYTNPHENGLHVHLSRAGFSSPCHVFRWMKLLHRNAPMVTAVARRDSDQWAAWSRDTRRYQKYLVKPQLLDRAQRYTRSGRERDRLQMARYTIDSPTRYQAINTTNQATFELRMFASSLHQEEVAAALALASSSVEYTRTLTPQAILRDGGWGWSAFTDYVRQTPSYAPLAKEIDKLCAC